MRVSQLFIKVRTEMHLSYIESIDREASLYTLHNVFLVEK